MLSLTRLDELLARFSGLTIGLVGDLFLDRYLEIDSETGEISVETGLQAYQVLRVRNAPGALGTVLNNLAALGTGRLVPVTAIGDDGHGYDLLRSLESLPVDPTHIVRAADRMTPTYTKPLKSDATGQMQELNRLDIRSREPMSAATRDVVCRHVAQVFRSCDGLIVLDQVGDEDQGVIDHHVRDHLRQLAANDPRKFVFCDSRAFLGTFDFGVLKGNQSEVTAAAGHDDPRAAVAELARRTDRVAFCTAGEDGILFAAPGADVMVAPGISVAGPIDIVGAGDSATSGIVLSILAGATAWEAAAIGNLVASITVQQLGTTGTATPQQVLARWRAIEA